MKMDQVYVNRRRVAFALVVAIIANGFTYLTRDTCYVGNMEGNFLGYGSCSKMLDLVVGK
jgi:hypothetical protein